MAGASLLLWANHRRRLTYSIQESKSQSITLHDDCPWIFARVLQYVYYGRYSKAPKGRAEPEMTPSVAEIVRGGCRGDWTRISKQGDPIMILRSEIRHNTANIAVYLLADKYCMTSLKEHAVYEMSLVMNCKELVDMAKDHLEHMSGLLKEWFACRIGEEYTKLSAEEDEDARTIKGWLAADPKLCFMVMEVMHGQLRAHYEDEDDEA